MKPITENQITYSVFEAIEEDKYLVIGNKNFLEYLSREDDGIFETQRSWKSFVNGNFREPNSDCFINEVKQTTIDKWTYSANKYINKFAVKVGQDKYIEVDSNDIELTYDYQLLYSRKYDDCFPSMVDIYVTAQIKKG